MPLVGEVLAGRYRVDAPLGAGGMAAVYRARDLRLERDVAVKVLLPNLAADPAVASRFDREARSLAAAAHPRIVSVFDVDPGDPTTGREPFYVMELCDGGSLADRLAAAGGRLEADDVVAATAAVAEGLADLHRRGVVHRDVKPHNILFSGGRAKLADFGLARSETATEMTALTVTGTTVGTLAYLAPELLAGTAATPASDVYALGVVAYLALTGRLPRRAGSMTELVEARYAPAPRPSRVAPGLGTAFDGPLAAALAIEPTARPAPLELAGWLETALRDWQAGRTNAGLSAADPTAQTIADLPVPALAAAGAVTTPAVLPVARAAGPVAVGGPIPDRRAADRRAGPSRWTGPRDPAPAESIGDRPGVLTAAAFAGILGALVLLMAMLGRDGIAGLLGPTERPTTAAVVSTPSPSPSPEPTPSPTPAPTPQATPTPDPRADARAALGDLYEAIDAARGRGGLRNRDADDLRQRADRVAAALDEGDYERARTEAQRLRAEVDDVDGRLDDEDADRLNDAVDRLIAAIPGD